jgi:hypothetical protein
MNAMNKLNLPEFSFRYRIYKEKKQIWDEVRKKYTALTPEEWVRQNFIAWLIREKKYPSGLIAIEKELTLNDLKKRFDVVVYNKSHLPVALIECKAPGVRIVQDVFDQVSRYNIVVQAKYLIVTNGMEHYCCNIDLENSTYSFMDQIPDYNNLF